MPTKDYKRKIQRDNELASGESRVARDIAAGYPEPGDLTLRNRCEYDFRLFCESYFPNAFNLAWSEDHIKVIAAIERAVLKSGLLALAMPRGSGKTALCVRAALWALLYGHRRFVCLIASTEGLAEKLMEPIKVELQYNERLAADFRQVCYPIQRLENNGRKCIGQLFEGEQTRITWGADRLTLPTVPDHVCDGKNVSGSTVTVAGLTGAIRGQSSTLADGTIIRPELVLLDDPQTRESAMSSIQSQAREAIIKGDVLGMAGPGRRISALMPCTVIRQGDMADLMLDRKKNPQWSGQRTKMVYSFPKEKKLWDEYAQLLVEAVEAEREPVEAMALYRANQKIMDEGGKVGWEARKYPDDISALQHAMNFKILDERMFFCEYQNDPLPENSQESEDLSHDQIAGKVNRMKRGQVPIGCSRLTAMIDVHETVLYYVVCAWEDNFTGHVIDYGTFPDQKLRYFSLRDAQRTLATEVKAAGVEGLIYGGLERIADCLLARDWQRDDHTAMRVERCLIDANYGTSTETVYRFCRQSAHSAVLTPSHGKYVGASGSPMREWGKRPGERHGDNWKLRSMAKRSIRSVVFDTNHWKSFVYARLAVSMGDRGCLSIFGEKPEEHRLFVDHIRSEYRIKTQGRGRTCDEWKPRAGQTDNHWLDCLVGCAVAASIQGVSLPETSPAAPKEKKRISFADLQRRKHGPQPPSTGA